MSPVANLKLAPADARNNSSVEMSMSKYYEWRTGGLSHHVDYCCRQLIYGWMPRIFMLKEV